MKTRQYAILNLTAALLLASCGGGGGGSPDTGGTGGATLSISQGVITAKGSIFVNGIEYSTSGATIRVDDTPVADDSFLREGMVVTVRGSSDDNTRKGTATQVEARDALEGTIQATGANSLTVMGQTVRIEDNLTRLNDDDTQKVFAQAGFQVGQHVEVHGFRDDQGGLRATRVARKTGGGEFESKGFVVNLGANSFGLAAAPGAAAFISVDFTAGQLPAGVANGSIVEVKANAAPSGGSVTASLIRREDRLGATGQKAEVEGIVTGGTLASFAINGQAVVTSASTMYEGGTSGDFAVGVKLEAEGPLDANGAIAAVKISFRSNIKIEAVASNVSANGLTVLGKTVAINAFTRIDNPPLAATKVEVRALPDRDGNLIATRIVVGVGNPTRAFLQGPVSAADAAAGTLTVLGTPVVSDNATEWRVSHSSTDAAVSKAQFYAQLRTGVTVVKVRWDNFSATTAPIKEAEIELGK
jgi:Domain of unknown function (DUF5666)